MSKKCPFFKLMSFKCLLVLQHVYHTSGVPTISWPKQKTYVEFKKTNYKYILFWYDKSWFDWTTEGQKLFLNNKCVINTCIFTSNRSLFGGSLSEFDAVLFHGPHLYNNRNDENLPPTRYSNQKYVYINLESAANYPVCHENFNEYYNWTITYRLDSDIQLKYLTITDRRGTIVAPNKRPNWLKGWKVIVKQLMDKIVTKSKAAAWYVSHCYTPIRRELYVEELQRELQRYNFNVDVYGACGNLSCAKENQSCDLMLKRDYFFYLAFENSKSEDYVTEKVLHGYNNGLVPIVYGGADYNRFLPPKSYIDASNIPAAKLAAKMNSIIKNKHVYAKYFW